MPGGALPGRVLGGKEGAEASFSVSVVLRDRERRPMICLQCSNRTRYI